MGSPLDEVIVLAALPQDTPEVGGQVRLELRRTRHSQLGGSLGLSAQEHTKADAEFLAKRSTASGENFLLAIEAPGVSATAVQELPFVSQKGADRTAKQLYDLLRKPGRDSLLEMYSADVAEFFVQVSDTGNSAVAGETLDAAHLDGLTLSL